MKKQYHARHDIAFSLLFFQFYAPFGNSLPADCAAILNDLTLRVMNWCAASWFLVGVSPPPWIELPLSLMHRSANHGEANSWSFASIHADFGNSLRAPSLAFSIFSIKMPYPSVGFATHNQAKRVGKLACQGVSADCSASVLRLAKQSA